MNETRTKLSSIFSNTIVPFGIFGLVVWLISMSSTGRNSSPSAAQIAELMQASQTSDAIQLPNVRPQPAFIYPEATKIPSGIETSQLTLLADGKFALEGSGAQGSMSFTYDQLQPSATEGTRFLTLATREYADVQILLNTNGRVIHMIGRSYGNGTFHGDTTELRESDGKVISEKKGGFCPFFIPISFTSKGQTTPLIDSFAINLQNSQSEGSVSIVNTSATHPPYFDPGVTKLFTPSCAVGVTSFNPPN